MKKNIQEENNLNQITDKLHLIKEDWQEKSNHSNVSNVDTKIEEISEGSASHITLEQIESDAPKKNKFQYFHSQFMQIFQPGLSIAQRVRTIPIVGYGLAIILGIFYLPKIRRQLSEHQQRQLIAEQSLLMAEQRHVESFSLIKSLIKHESLRLDQYDKLDIGQRLMQLDQLQLARQNKSLQLMLKAQREKEDILNLRIAALESNTVYKNNLIPIDSCNKEIIARETISKVEISKAENQFYVEFEALFRGDRTSIKERLKVYLPYLQLIPKDQDGEWKKVIDVGCGRGEWLELLAENEIPCMGVDMNSHMVNICIANSLYACCDDAISVLRKQPSNSVGAVTGFHIIEHLPFELLLELFDAALNALSPGGLIIFETPNPENVKVGSCSFYSDPTHLHPIVPQVAEFMAKQRGFTKTQILRLHPLPDENLLKGGSPVEELINKEFFGPQDYAVIGRK